MDFAQEPPQTLVIGLGYSGTIGSFGGISESNEFNFDLCDARALATQRREGDDVLHFSSLGDKATDHWPSRERGNRERGHYLDVIRI